MPKIVPLFFPESFTMKSDWTVLILCMIGGGSWARLPRTPSMRSTSSPARRIRAGCSSPAPPCRSAWSNSAPTTRERLERRLRIHRRQHLRLQPPARVLPKRRQPDASHRADRIQPRPVPRLPRRAGRAVRQHVDLRLPLAHPKDEETARPDTIQPIWSIGKSKRR